MKLKEYQSLRLRRRQLGRSYEETNDPELLEEIQGITAQIKADPPTLEQAYASVALVEPPEGLK